MKIETLSPRLTLPEFLQSLDRYPANEVFTAIEIASREKLDAETIVNFLKRNRRKISSTYQQQVQLRNLTWFYGHPKAITALRKKLNLEAK